MQKLQQFDIISLTYDEIRSGGYALQMSVKRARELGCLVSLGDSEVLRAIRRISGHPYDEVKLKVLEDERKSILRSENSECNRASIGKINSQIDEQLYIKQFVAVSFRTTKEYTILNEKGFSINGERYTWLMCGAGHQRTNRAMYVAESIYAELDEILRNGANVQEMVLAKYNAYYALSSSSTYKVSAPRVCVVKDCELQMTKLVDFCRGEEISRCEKELSFNVFDGQGLISPEFSKRWANDIGITDYVPSAWGVRCAFIKGMCVTFDFHKFAKERVDGEPIITDVWGNSVDIRNIDVILSQSQFKLWSGYNNWDEYNSNLKRNGLSWGVSKVSPKEDAEKTMMMTNYQFLQVLQLTDDEIRGLCGQTVDWINGVACGDLQKTKLYLLGNIANKRSAELAFRSVQDDFVKCLLMNEFLLDDDYIRSRIVKSVNKKIRESYFGNLIIDGNFMARISDPYAQCEFIFNLPLQGLLSDNEHYAMYWNKRGKKNVVAMRSPLTYKTEAHMLNLKTTKECDEWYKYLTSGVVYNIWGVDCLLEAGADYDFDIVATTDNRYFLKGILGTNIPVTYEARKAKKERITREGLIRIAGVGFSPEIGVLTNHSTTFHDMQSKYAKDTEEWQVLEDRLKFCCELQSMQIDKAKGIEIDEIPKWWTSYSVAKKKDGGEPGINVKLLIEHRPYFMRYRYDEYNKAYRDLLSDKKRYCIVAFGNENGEGFENTQEYTEMQKYFTIKSKVSDNKGVMNKICHLMEQELCEVKKKREKEPFNLYSLLWKEGEELDGEILAEMENEMKKYLSFRQNTRLEQTNYVTWEQYFKTVRTECLSTISNNLIELARYATFLCYVKYAHKGKDFAWDCFGAGISQRMKEIYHFATVPILNADGNIRYLGKTYTENIIPIIDVSGIEEEEFDDSDFISDIDNILAETEGFFADIEL